MKVAVIKYNAGNIRSVDYALKRLGVEAVITSDKEVLKAADKVIFPGVGEAETTMLHLKESGMDRFIKELRQPGHLPGHATDVPLLRRGECRLSGYFRYRCETFCSSEARGKSSPHGMEYHQLPEE